MEISEGMRKFASLNNVSAYEVLLHIQRFGHFYGEKSCVIDGQVMWPAVTVNKKVLVLDDFRKIFRRKI